MRIERRNDAKARNERAARGLDPDVAARAEAIARRELAAMPLGEGIGAGRIEAHPLPDGEIYVEAWDRNDKTARIFRVAGMEITQ